MECIILAGGLGTRLQGVIGEQPKCMAPVNGLPFLHYIFKYLDRQPVTRVILSLGYKSNVVLDWLEDQEIAIEVDYVIENEPLGTGGGILAAIEEAVTDHVAVLNGDTFFSVNMREMMREHLKTNALTTLALKEMQQFERYGSVDVAVSGKIEAFHEKKFTESGLINGGIYMINREAFFEKKLPGKCSFEKDYLEKYVKEGAFYGYKADGYFIDIGIPDDYQKAQTDFKTLFA